ncbi:MAG: DUF4956 domain-containing protein [Oscillospiraceae bacterium]|nr:DUF4956 domain-containing protein [Oscillospiraceae bacterium]
MSFSDVIKKSVLEKSQAGDLSAVSITVTLVIAILLGLFIYFIYRTNNKSGFYNRGFNKSLATLPVITAAIIMAMGSNLTISLGMVGALSIVRFRNAVKDPADLTYLFWSISMGIVTGAGLFKLAVILSIVVAVLVMALDYVPLLRTPCLLIVEAESVDVEKELISSVKNQCKSCTVRSRSINKKGVEWILEMQTEKEAELVKNVCEISGVSSVHMMTHDGEVRF